MPVVELRGVTKRFGARVACDDISFQVDAGETYGLLGPNGAGKTTCIHVLCGLLAPDAGTAAVVGHDIVAEPMLAKAAIGFVPQDLALYPDLSARENLTFFGRLQGLRGKHLHERVDHSLEVVGLVERAGDRIDDYSGGMKRRANIAAGLLHEPALLVLDEPTVGVDPQSRNAILAAVDELGGAGLSVLYTTHYMEEAERLCDRVGVIDQGRLIAEGTRAELTALTCERSRIRLRTTATSEAVTGQIRAIRGVDTVTVTAEGLDVLVDDTAVALAPVVAAVGDVQGVDIHEADLEAVFLHLTGKALRD